MLNIILPKLKGEKFVENVFWDHRHATKGDFNGPICACCGHEGKCNMDGIGDQIQAMLNKWVSQ